MTIAQTESTHEQKPASLLWLVPIVAAFAVTHYRAALWMWNRWRLTESYYSHGFLIPIVSLALLYQMRDRLESVSARGRGARGAGVVLILFGTLAQLAGTFAEVYLLCWFAFLFVVVGLVFVLYGTRMVSVTLFPVLFLIFMMPLPLQLIADINFRMKDVAASLATGILDLTPLTVAKQGAAIFFRRPGDITDQVTVGAPCSGLKSMIALIALGTLFSYLSGRCLWKKAFLLAVSVPLAVFANTVRIVVLCIASYWIGSDKATGNWLVHYGTGMLIFLVAFCGLFVFDRVLRMLPGKDPPPPQPDPPSDDPPVWRVSNRAFGMACLLLVPMLGLTLYFGRQIPGLEGTKYATQIPRVIGEWQGGEDKDPDPVAARILETNDIMERVYTRGSETVGIIIVFAKNNRQSSHPPEICFVGDGWEVVSKEPHVIRTEDGRDTGMAKLFVTQGKDRLLCLYTFKTGDFYTESYYKHQIHMLLNQIARKPTGAALIRTTTRLQPGETVTSAFPRLEEFTQAVLPHVFRTLP